MAEKISLGTVERARKLFSFPPNNNEVFSPALSKQKLEETVKHYIGASLKRDSFLNSTISVRQEDGELLAEIDGEAAAPYALALKALMAAGDTAYKKSEEFAKNEKWQYNWRFFLPLGLAMTNHLTVQLMHFPPDYALEKDQDYLIARTTEHWANLLAANGAKPDETDRYQTIVDIAPIAAPAGDGQKIKPIGVEYGNYIVQLLQAWLPRPSGVRPMVAFGGAVRDWLRDQKIEVKGTYGPGTMAFRCGILTVTPDLKVPVLEANHPSYILIHQHDFKDDPDTPEDERVGSLMLIMQQDLIAAAWQVQMGSEPEGDPADVLEKCKAIWSDPAKSEQIAELIRTLVLSRQQDDTIRPLTAVPKNVIKEALNPASELGKKSEELLLNTMEKLRARAVGQKSFAARAGS